MNTDEHGWDAGMRAGETAPAPGGIQDISSLRSVFHPCFIRGPRILASARAPPKREAPCAMQARSGLGAALAFSSLVASGEKAGPTHQPLTTRHFLPFSAMIHSGGSLIRLLSRMIGPGPGTSGGFRKSAARGGPWWTLGA